MEILNTILFALLTVFVALQQLLYSRQRLKAKDEKITTKEAEIAALKTSAQSMKDLSAQIHQLVSLYDPEKIKNYVKLSEDEAQLAAQKIISENSQENEEKVKSLMVQIDRLKQDLSTTIEDSIKNPKAPAIRSSQHYVFIKHQLEGLKHNHEWFYNSLISTVLRRSIDLNFRFSVNHPSANYGEALKHIEELGSEGHISFKIKDGTGSNTKVMNISSFSKEFVQVVAYVTLLDAEE